jgi:hypothetical protein
MGTKKGQKRILEHLEGSYRCPNGPPGPVRPGPGEARPVLGPARQARLKNRAGPVKHAGSIPCPSPARNGSTKKAGRKAGYAGRKARFSVKKAGLTGLELNGPCRASPPCLISCPSPARLFVPGRPGPAYNRAVPGSDRAQKTGFVPGSRASCLLDIYKGSMTSNLSRNFHQLL